MAENKKVIELANRTWARTPDYGRFFGTYIEREQLWFASSINEADSQRILRSFAQTPPPLQQLARAFHLTISVARDLRALGLGTHASCIYGDWHQVRVERVSPHLEIGQESLKDDNRLLAHLTHELGHLLFWSFSDEQRSRLVVFWESSLESATIEVTPYVQRRLNDHRDAKCRLDQRHLTCDWVQESFAETIAVFQVPSYSLRSSDCNTDISARIDFIEELAGIRLQH